MPRLMLICLGVFAAAGLVPLSAAGQARTPADVPVVVATGEGVVHVVPDRAWVTISAESRSSSPREAQRLNAQAMTAVTAKLESTGLTKDAIRTSAYDLQPQFDHRDGKQTLRGYVARNSVEVRLDDIGRVGEIIDLAVASGATSVSGVRFDLKNRAEAEREALRRAVADARSRAEALADGAGLRIVNILRIDEGRAVMVAPQPMMARMGVEMAADAPPIAPGEQQVRANVTLTASVK